ncbi:MAG: putative quinol monooxygenase [Mycoplasmatota bacterium]
MQYITVITDIVVKNGYVEVMKQELLKLVEPTRNEYGCILYEFYQDINNPLLFRSYEKWINMEVIERHLNTNYIKNYMTNTKNITEYFKINYFKKLI